ncbi:MAG: putative sensor with domain, partial [Acidimicrobiia bacterium]|nr:putative sensor with domain [Acidimicrobiia bacterium]
LAHLVAELLDNATQFSPPTSGVEVHGRMTGGSCVLEIRDTGIGMNPEQLAEANRTLNAPPVNGLALSRSLGFIVVGRLAERHGVVVSLESRDSGGVLARLVVPAALLGDSASDGAAPASEAPAWAPPLAAAEVKALELYNVEEVEPLAASSPELVSASGAGPRRRAEAGNGDDGHTDSWADPEAVSTGQGASEATSADPAAVPMHRDIPLELWARLVGPPSSAWGDTDVASPHPTVSSGAIFEASDHYQQGQESAPPASELLWDSAPTLDEALGRDAAGADCALAVLLQDSQERATADPAGNAAASDGPAWGRRTPEPREYGAMTAAGLPRRRSTRTASVVEANTSTSLEGDGAVASTRSPDEIRALLSSYRNGLSRGRTSGPDEGATE